MGGFLFALTSILRMIQWGQTNYIDMAKPKVIAVTPIFSLLDEKLAGLVTKEALVYQEVIEKSLERYKDIPRVTRTISIDKLHTRLSGTHATISLALQKALFIYYEKEEITTPFLLGLAVEQLFLEKIQDIQSIEIFEEGQLFLDRLGRSTQLCLRRRGSVWVVDISTYVYRGLINAGERESATSVNKISFVEAPVEELAEKSEDLSNRIIG